MVYGLIEPRYQHGQRAGDGDDKVNTVSDDSDANYGDGGWRVGSW